MFWKGRGKGDQIKTILKEFYLKWRRNADWKFKEFKEYLTEKLIFKLNDSCVKGKKWSNIICNSQRFSNP